MPRQIVSRKTKVVKVAGHAQDTPYRTTTVTTAALTFAVGFLWVYKHAVCMHPQGNYYYFQEKCPRSQCTMPASIFFWRVWFGCENSSVLGKAHLFKSKMNICTKGLQFYQVIKQWGVFCSLQLCMQLKLCSPNGCPTRYYYSTATLLPHHCTWAVLCHVIVKYFEKS